MNDGVQFDTEVEGVWGYSSGAPKVWSYSSLKDVEVCPRRWVLSRARYPDIWDRNGYPEVPRPAALLGIVIHHALEVIVRALAARGCTDTNSNDAVDVLRGLGGLSAVLRQAIDLKVTELGRNPRIDADARENLRQALIDHLGDATNHVQLFLSSGRLPAWAASDEGVKDEGGGPRGRGSSRRRRTALVVGIHPEVDVVAEDLRLWGQIDLVTVEDSGVTITDFKSGKDDPSHDDQLRLYALLWDLDRESNPERVAVTKLVVSYPSRERAVPAPDASSLRGLEASTRARVEAADVAVSGNNALANPGPETCEFCPVRHLCPEFWQDVAPSPLGVAPGDWFDLEATVVRQNGVKSWVVESAQGRVRMLVRTPSPSNRLPIGRRVRILGVRKVEDPDREELVMAALGSSSETYVLSD